jgi:hypothetical protein
MRHQDAKNPASQDCARCETLLTDALDGRLNPEDEQAFSAHMLACESCAALMEEAHKGREWLNFLEPEPEVPVELLNKILAQTGPDSNADQGLATGSGNVLPMPPVPAMLPEWQQAGFGGRVRQYMQPQLLMTAAMAFFSIALTLNLTGFSVRNMSLAELRPSAMRSTMERRLSNASTPLVRYYDRLLLVCQVETRSRLPLLNNQSESPDDSNTSPKHKQLTPGESKALPEKREHDSGTDSRLSTKIQQQNPSLDLLEVRLNPTGRFTYADSSTMAARERDTVWSA